MLLAQSGCFCWMFSLRYLRRLQQNFMLMVWPWWIPIWMMEKMLSITLVVQLTWYTTFGLKHCSHFRAKLVFFNCSLLIITMIFGMNLWSDSQSWSFQVWDHIGIADVLKQSKKKKKKNSWNGLEGKIGFKSGMLFNLYEYYMSHSFLISPYFKAVVHKEQLRVFVLSDNIKCS